MTRPDRASLALTAPLVDVLALLLRQFRRPLAAHDVVLSDADAGRLAEAIVAGAASGDKAAEVRTVLVALVGESERVLRGWGLSFEQAMDTGMDRMPGWHTTAEFLDMANEKSNAEIRIAVGAALVAALGDLRYASYLLFLARRPGADVDAAVARRVLAHLSGVPLDAPDWEPRVRAWLDARAG